MTGTTPVITEKRDDVLTIVLNRPERRNAFSLPMLEMLSELVEGAYADGCRAIVVSGAGPVFSAGGDIKFARELLADPDRLDPVWETLMATFQRVVMAFRESACLSVAAVEGAAVGAGISLALATDLRVAASDSALLPIWMEKGTVPDGGASYLLSRMLGSEAMRSLVLRGEPVPAERALGLGLVDEVVPPGEAVRRAIELADRYKTRSGDALVVLRALADAASHNSPRDQIRLETDHLRLLRKSEERQQALISWSSQRNGTETP